MSPTADGGGTPRLTVETEPTDHGIWVRLRGIADISTLTELDVAFTGINLDGQRSVQIDVSDLDFVDVAALRRLVTFANAARQSGHDVTTCGARPMLHRMAHILEVRDDLGLS